MTGSTPPRSGQPDPAPQRRSPDETATLVKRLLQLVQGMRSAGTRSEGARRALLGVALLAFLAMGFIALRNYPDDVPQEPNWIGLVLVGILGPTLTIFANAEEYRLQGRMVDLRVHRSNALQTTIVGTAANLLPIPGSMVVRTQAIAARAGYRAAIRTTTIAGAAWLFCTVALAGVAMFFVDLPLVAAILLVVAAAGLGATAWLMRRNVATWRRLFAELLVVETLTAVIGAGRLLGILLTLGLEVSVGQAVALTLSGVIASATGIFPAGLGVREAVAAGIASTVALPASIGFVATAADRIAGLVILAVASGIVLVVKPRPVEPDTPGAAHEPHT